MLYQNTESGRISFLLLRCASLVLSLSFIQSGCSVPLYNIAPIPRNTPIAGQKTTTNLLEITAAALLEDDLAFERFGTNLPLAGILVVDVSLINRATESTGALKFELADSTGKHFSRLDAKKQLKQMMKFDGTRLYAITGKEQTLEQLQSIALPNKFALAPNSEQQGVLFFHVKQDVTALKGLVLTIKSKKHAATIPLN